jgi:hypothetical protein
MPEAQCSAALQVEQQQQEQRGKNASQNRYSELRLAAAIVPPCRPQLTLQLLLPA